MKLAVSYPGSQRAAAFLQAVEQAAAMWFISDPSPSLRHTVRNVLRQLGAHTGTGSHLKGIR